MTVWGKLKSRVKNILLLSLCIFLTSCSLDRPIAVVTNAFDTQKAQSFKEQKVTVKSNTKTDWGGETVYELFSSSRYDEAIYNNYTILLNFISSDCQTCEVEKPDLIDELKNVDPRMVVAFEIDMKSKEGSLQALVREYDVKKPMTKIVLKNGIEVLRDNRPWGREELKNALTRD